MTRLPSPWKQGRSHGGVPRPAGTPPVLTLVLAAGVLSGCDVPSFEGPQIQSPPRGFLLVQDSPLQRRMFQDRDVVFETAWVESVSDFSTIHVNGHAGAMGLEDVMAARDVAMRFAEDPDRVFGDVEPLRVDGREAWGWAERVESQTRGLVSVAYRAAVSYDTVTYAIEFHSGEPGLKRAAPDTLKAIIASFAIGETRLNVPLIALLTGGLLFAVAGLRSRARSREARLQDIRLVRVEKPTEEPSEEEAEPAGAAAGPGGPDLGAATRAAGAPAALNAFPPGARRTNPPR